MLLQGRVRGGQTVVVDYDSAKDSLTFSRAVPVGECTGAGGSRCQASGWDREEVTDHDL